MSRIDDLPPFARHWTQAAMRWSDQHWDETVGLVQTAFETHPDAPLLNTRVHLVRDTIWYATGLLMRGDHERAYRAIEAVLGYQLDKPGRVFHGTFKRAPQEPQPPENPTEWRDYDPNWREFICTILLVLLREFDLPDDLQARMWAAIGTAAAGAHTRNVVARYTNIALMSAFLLDHAGAKLDVPAWREHGKAMAGETFDLFRQYNTFWEYNSPTYYGVDLYALALWRNYGRTALFRDLGAQMEAGLWRDIAQFYHAGLRNLCGPYDRSYGMDMTKYIAVVGLYIALVVPPEQASLPDPQHPFDHASDFFYMPPIGLLGTQVPDDALPHFQDFQGERHVIRQVDGNREASAWLSERLMLGGEFAPDFKPPTEQFHPATAHWRLPDGATGWLRLRCDKPISARAMPGILSIICDSPRHIRFEIFAGDISPDAVQAANWSLPGLKIVCDLADIAPSVALDEDRLNVTVDVPTGGFSLKFASLD